MFFEHGTLLFSKAFGWSGSCQPCLLFMTQGHCWQVNRYHHNLSATMMGSSGTFYIFLCIWESFPLFHFLCILIAIPTLMVHCPNNAAIVPPVSLFVLICCSPTAGIYFTSSVSWLVLKAILLSFSFGPMSLPLRSRLFAISASLSLFPKHKLSPCFFVTINLSSILRRRFIVIISFLSWPHCHFIVTVTSSSFLCHCLLVTICSSFLLRRWIFVTGFCPHIFVITLSSPFLSCHFLSPSHRHHFFVASSHHCFLVFMLSSQSHVGHFSVSNSPSLFSHRRIFI